MQISAPIRHASSRPDARALVPANQGVERLAAEQLHHHVDGRAVAIEVVDGHDVGMSERLGFARLALQGLQ